MYVLVKTENEIGDIGVARWKKVRMDKGPSSNGEYVLDHI